MSDEKEKSKNAFNFQADKYDSEYYSRHARTVYPNLLKILSETPYESALDLGCGTGEVIYRILEADSSKKIYGLDISENMIEVSRKKLGDRATLVLGDSEYLPFDDNFFDKVYCCDSFHHYPNPENVLAEIKRVLKPNGVFVMCDYYQSPILRLLMNIFIRYTNEGDVKIYSEKEIHGMLSKYFSGVELKRIGKNALSAVGVKK